MMAMTTTTVDLPMMIWHRLMAHARGAEVASSLDWKFCIYQCDCTYLISVACGLMALLMSVNLDVK